MTGGGARAERAANREFALARRAARHHQVGDVGAGDQQHDSTAANMVYSTVRVCR